MELNNIPTYLKLLYLKRLSTICLSLLIAISIGSIAQLKAQTNGNYILRPGVQETTTITVFKVNKGGEKVVVGTAISFKVIP